MLKINLWICLNLSFFKLLCKSFCNIHWSCNCTADYNCIRVTFGTLSTDAAIDMAKYAESLGYDAVSAVAPYYYGFPLESITGYYNEPYLIISQIISFASFCPFMASSKLPALKSAIIFLNFLPIKLYVLPIVTIFRIQANLLLRRTLQIKCLKTKSS